MMRQRPQARRGGALLEAAITLPLLLLLLLAVIDYGRLIMTRDLMDNAAREGARLAVVSAGGSGASPTLTTAQIQSYTTGFLAGQGSGSPVVSIYQADPVTFQNTGVAWNAAPYGGYIAVQIQLTFQPISPLVIPQTMQLTAKSIMKSEAN